jgi:hypothetical protein
MGRDNHYLLIFYPHKIPGGIKKIKFKQLLNLINFSGTEQKSVDHRNKSSIALQLDGEIVLVIYFN